MKFYQSPRWSQEILDCSMPMTFDTYNKCSYNCLYCFSYFQKSHTLGKGGVNTGNHDYQNATALTWVNPEKINKILSRDETTNKSDQQFFNYIKEKKVIQWGGLADQFDEYERKNGITLELLKLFKKYNYPICFSTKATWWVYNDKYRGLFKDQNNWNVKFSIINLDNKKAKVMEKGVETPHERLKAIKEYTKLNKGGATLRLRPFVIGLTDYKDDYLELIRLAKEHGATAVSTEFFCVEGRADERLKNRYKQISEIIGFDLLKYYKNNSLTSGYYRLNRNIKEPYIKKMYDLCKKLGLRFYVSDAHFKEYCHNGSCCGLDDNWNYSRGQFTEALIIAKEKGKVKFSDIKKDIDKFHGYKWQLANGYNCNTSENRAKRYNQSMSDYIREIWNTPNSNRSPYKYFEGVLYPIGLDKNKDVIYEYRG